MLLIWGFRSKAHQLAVMTYLCGRCGNPASHPLTRITRFFTLFLVPLFPVSDKYFAQCTYCGQATRMSKEQAETALAPIVRPTPAAARPAREQHPAPTERPAP